MQNLSNHNENNIAYLHAMVVAGAVLFSLPLQFLQGNAQIFVGFLLPQLFYMIAVFVFVFAIKKAKTFKQINNFIPVNKPKIGSLVLTLPASIGMFCAFLIFGVSVSYIFASFGINSAPVLPENQNIGLIFLTIFIVAVLPGVFEELFFRGLYLTALKDRGLVQTIVFSSLIFAFSHMNPLQIIYQFLLGATLAFITIKTKSVIYAIIMHFLSNTFVIILPLFISFFAYIHIFSWANMVIMAIISFVGFTVLIPSTKFLIKFANKGEKIEEIAEKTENQPNIKRNLGIAFICLLAFLILATIVVAVAS